MKEGIYCGDSFRLLRRLKPESVALILTDPPYNTSRPNNLDTMGRRGIDFDWDGGFDQVGWLKAAVDALKPGGSMVIWNDWKNFTTISEALRILGMDVKNMLHWYKFDPMPRNKDRRVIQRMEYAILAVKPGAAWTFHMDGAPVRTRKCCVPGELADARFCSECGRRLVAKGYEDGIFYHNTEKDIMHPTKKSDGLFEDCINVFSNPGDLVVDPFCGVGTTALAALNTARRSISFELDWIYVMWANHLLKKAKSKKKQLVTA